jgi:hypothetical protein
LALGLLSGWIGMFQAIAWLSFALAVLALALATIAHRAGRSMIHV